MSIAAGLTNLGVLAIVVHPIPFFNERSPVRRAPRGVGYHNDPAEPGGGLGLCRLALRYAGRLPPRLCHLVRGLAAGGPSGPVCVQACGVDYHSWLYWPTRRGAGL